LIQVGQVLDKYELLERVGQGGMAVVYRGLDRSLKRTVAIKILHKHLSDYQEARDRFEREAQAVAKLRHENILEIFDYAAKEGEESYIVTEFIDGQTLKQFTTERPIAYPEIGAMIILQVCRALAHAHAGGILHRDVKPENIMIRSDGIVKLMDFGISHMVDLERLTVTGQLLGSPAYMAPEHVEGRPLDFRTDVFAAGIVLYQLCVGRLPFEGKNPHEVLKRIAECKFVDPRQANPRIGNRLGKIILRAMAAAPVDRYPAIAEMVLAIEAYLEESGISKDKVPAELARYFQAPASYEQALKDRLVDHLARRGQELLDEGNKAGALDAFDRVLTIDPQNVKVLDILGSLNRRAKLKHFALAVCGCVVLAAGAFGLHEAMKPPPPEPPAVDVAVGSEHAIGPRVDVAHDQAPPPQIDAGVADAGTQVAVVTPHIDAGVDAVAVVPTKIVFSPFDNSEYSIDDGPWLRVPPEGVVELPLSAAAKLSARNPRAQTTTQTIQPGPDQTVVMPFNPGHVIPTCKLPVQVTVNNKLIDLGKPFTVTFGVRLDSSVPVTIQFTGTGVDESPINKTVEAGKDITVECVLR
jgi:serine/threonine-protein kinase